MTSCYPLQRLRGRRLYHPARGVVGLAWCLAVLVCCGCLSLRTTVVHAQFASNPFPLLALEDDSIVANGITSGDHCGVSVARVGDMSGDDIDDFVIGADRANSEAGQAFLLFGRDANNPWEPSDVQLPLSDGSGVVFRGDTAGERVGFRVAGVRDVNGDGFNDVLIGTQRGDVAYLVFGTNAPWPDVVDLVDGLNGVKIEGVDSTGASLSDVGDVNNDGIPDFAIGSHLAETGAGPEAGRVDVLYGRDENSVWPSVVSLPAYVNASTGFSVTGSASDDRCGFAVSGVGDVNGDGVDDIAVGCVRADANGALDAGLVAVVFGSASLPEVITPSLLNGTNGFVVNGEKASDSIGLALSRVGDVNADCVDDLVIGGPEVVASSGNGALYVLFGRNASVTPWPAAVNASSIVGTASGFALYGSGGSSELGFSVSGAGDVNADGINDVLVGAPGGSDGGRGFLLYGSAVLPPSQIIDDLENVVTFQGDDESGQCGSSVSDLGDINGDGRGDLAFGCPGVEEGRTSVVFGPMFTPPPTRRPATTVPTSSPSSPTSAAPVTPSPTTFTCATQGAFIPPGATCVNGVLVTTSNTTTAPDTTSTVTTSVTVTGGASFEQSSGSTLVFVAGGGGGAGSGGSTSIAVQDGGCATIAGNAVVSFESDPSNGGSVSTTGSLVLVTADCVMGAFGSVSATTSFDGDECVSIGDGEQQSSGSSISVSFGLSNACTKNGSGLSTGALVGIIVGACVVTVVVVIVAVKLSLRARNLRAQEDVKMSHMKR